MERFDYIFIGTALGNKRVAKKPPTPSLASYTPPSNTFSFKKLRTPAAQQLEQPVGRQCPMAHIRVAQPLGRRQCGRPHTSHHSVHQQKFAKETNLNQSIDDSNLVLNLKHEVNDQDSAHELGLTVLDAPASHGHQEQEHYELQEKTNVAELKEVALSLEQRKALQKPVWGSRHGSCVSWSTSTMVSPRPRSQPLSRPLRPIAPAVKSLLE